MRQVSWDTKMRFGLIRVRLIMSWHIRAQPMRARGAHYGPAHEGTGERIRAQAYWGPAVRAQGSP